jgi:hypothetical protein
MAAGNFPLNQMVGEIWANLNAIMAKIGRIAVASAFELSQYESLTWRIYWRLARQAIGMTVRAGARAVSAASAETMNPYKRGVS